MEVTFEQMLCKDELRTGIESCAACWPKACKSSCGMGGRSLEDWELVDRALHLFPESTEEEAARLAKLGQIAQDNFNNRK